MHHRNILIELHQCTKFGVDSSKFPRTGGPHVKKVFRLWRVQPAPHRNGNHKSTQVGVSIHVTFQVSHQWMPTVWPVGAGKGQ